MLLRVVSIKTRIKTAVYMYVVTVPVVIRKHPERTEEAFFIAVHMVCTRLIEVTVTEVTSRQDLQVKLPVIFHAEVSVLLVFM